MTVVLLGEVLRGELPVMDDEEPPGVRGTGTPFLTKGEVGLLVSSAAFSELVKCRCV